MTPMADDDTPIACSLDAEEMAVRGQEIAALRALSGTRTQTGITLHFARGSEAAVRELARRESACCPFLQLRVAVDDDTGVRLDVDGPEEARPIVEAFLQMAAPQQA
jgi:hypothetical protein